MSDDDRLADYFARLENDDYRRTLPDGCCCYKSLAACHASWYVANQPCCPACQH